MQAMLRRLQGILKVPHDSSCLTWSFKKFAHICEHFGFISMPVSRGDKGRGLHRYSFGNSR